MEGPRAPVESEFPSLINFLDQNLRPQAGWSIQQEYPTALHPSNLANIRIIKDENEVLSHAVVRPILVKTPIGVFKVAGIGSVVTNSHYRQQGLSQQIIQNCLQTAIAQNCDFAILWTNLYDFYRKFGFELAGTEISYRLTGRFPTNPHRLKFLTSNKVDPAAIYKLFSKHTVSTVRTVDEIRRYLQIPNSRVYTTWNTDGTLAAYAIEGKGADLTGYIHEWGGNVSQLLPLLEYVTKSENREFTVITPKHAVNLRQKLTDFDHKPYEGFLGMIRILQPMNLFGKIIRHARVDHGENDLRLEYKDGQYLIGVGSSLFNTPSDTDMVRLIFGPQNPLDLHPFDDHVLKILEKVLPIRMWIWGWDSV